MKLRDIEVGETYAVRAAAPTDRTRWFGGGTCAADLLRRPGEAQKLVLFCEAEVVAVAVPYKKGRQGVTFEGVSERVVKCRCIDCGDEHPKLPADAHQLFETRPESIQFTVHCSQVKPWIVAAAEDVAYEASWEARRAEFQRQVAQFRKRQDEGDAT